MKKYLLLIVSMLCVSIGTWAEGFGNGSSYTIDGTTITINVGTAGDFDTWVTSLGTETTPTLTAVQACTNVTFTGTLNADDLAKFNQFTAATGDFDLRGASLANGTSFSSATFAPSDTKVFTVYLPASIPVTNNFMTGNVPSGITVIGVSGSTASIYIPFAQFTEAKLAKCPAGITTAVIYSGGSGYDNETTRYGTTGNAILQNSDLEKLYPTNFGSASSTLKTLDLSNTQSWAESDYNTHFNNYTASGNSGTNASLWTIVIDPAKKVTTNGAITSTEIAAIKAANCSSIDFRNATFSPSLSILDLSSSVKGIVLPAGTVLDDAQKASLQSSFPNLYYVYIPSNSAGTAANHYSDAVADYVYVVQSGGLKEACAVESTLRAGTYIKVESSVALNTTDINFLGMGEGKYPTAYTHLDLSGANISKTTMASYTCPHWVSPYRVILPDDWSAEDLASVASLTNNHSIAAFYSNTGTTLKVMALSSTYSNTALSDYRIVRTGTTTVEFVSAVINSTTYGGFYESCLGAANNAQDITTIKSIKVSTSQSVPNTLTFTNTNITNLDLSGITIGSANLTTSSCTALQTINLSGSRLNSVNTSGCANLQAVSLIGTTISGAFDVHDSGITRITVDTSIGGTITATGCTSLNRITNSGTIGGDIIANGTSDAGLSNLTTFINNGTINGDVNLSYSGLTTFTNNGSVKNINLSHCDATGFTTFAPAGTINGDIDLTDCTKLTSINVANATINNRHTYNTGYSADVNFTRGSETVVTNSVYDNLKDGDNRYNVTIASSGQDDLTIIPTVTAKTAAPASTSVAGVTEDDCALTVGISGTETLTSLLQKFYAMKNNIQDYTTVTTGVGGDLSTLNICNLTITGEIDDTDIATINALTFGKSLGAGIVWRDATLNLDGATLKSGVSLGTTKITNTTVNNIILPRNLDKDVVNPANFSSCNDLNAAVSLNAARTQVVGYVKKAGNLRQTLSQVPDFQRNPWQYMQGLNLPSVTLTGELLACDIATGNDHVISNGNYKQNPESSEKLTGYDCCLDNHVGLAFEGVSTLRNLDIKDAIFVDGANTENIMEENMTLSELGWAGIVSLKMPYNSKMKNVPARFLKNCKQISYLCIPYYYETIGDEAFYLTGTNWITTTDKNGAEIDNGINTYTFSKNLKQIGTDPGKYANSGKGANYPGVPTNPVFGAVNSGEIHDIYFLSSDAPKCWRGAFASGMTYGWGGFDGGNIYCREKYKNGAFLFTVLNYPQGLTEEQEKKYTDITKVYTKKDQTGAVDANGESIPWPTFSELGRSYNQAIRGLVWEDWNVDPTLQAEGNINGGTINFDPTALPDKNTSEQGTPEYTQFYDYVGLHEFVLSKATYVAPDETVINDEIVRYYKQDDWYTFCIPFDMTEAQVAELLGVPASNTKVINEHSSVTYSNYLQAADENGHSAGKVEGESIMPQIITLKGVARNSTSNLVSLRCSMDLASGDKANTYYNPATTKYEDNGTIDLGGAAPENVVIRAGYPYMIRPYVLCSSTGVKQAVEKNNLGKQVLTRYTFKEAASGINRAGCYEEIGGNITGETSKFAKPWEGHKVQAISEGSGDSAPLKHTNNMPYNYTFIGQFWKQDLPLNSFYMSGYKWYHYTTKNSAYYWNPYLCIITVSDENTSSPYYFRTATNNNADANTTKDTILPQEVAADEKGHAVFNRQMEIRFKDGLDDSFTSSARMYQFVFEDDIMDFEPDGQATAIEVLDGVRIAPVHGKVYNMAGQQVGNSLEGLSKGMYIVNGKKYVIK